MSCSSIMKDVVYVLTGFFFFSGGEEVRHVSWLCGFFFLKTLWL